MKLIIFTCLIIMVCITANQLTQDFDADYNYNYNYNILTATGISNSTKISTATAIYSQNILINIVTICFALLILLA